MKTSDTKLAELTDPAGRKHVALKTNDGWRTTGGVHLYSDEVAADFKVRPLVVLDLDEVYGKDQIIAALRDVYPASTGYKQIRDYLALKIEKQTQPPKPEEPQGLGAVVDGGNGQTYVRIWGGVEDGEANVWLGASKDPVAWSDIRAPIKVLSEGLA